MILANYHGEQTFWGLRGEALEVALAFHEKFPPAVFSRGIRTLRTPCRDMAGNVHLNRMWILETYKASKPALAAHAWVMANKHVRAVGDIADGLEFVLRTFTPEELESLSRHMTGDAFDLKPRSVTGAMRDWLAEEAKKRGALFLDREGGLVRYHWQAKRSPMQSTVQR